MQVTIYSEQTTYDARTITKSRTFEGSNDFSHCPYCGIADTIFYEPDSEVDYGGGDFHICIKCGCTFYGNGHKENLEIAQKIRDKIKERLHND